MTALPELDDVTTRARRAVRTTNLLTVGLAMVCLVGVWSYLTGSLASVKALGLAVAPALVAVSMLKPAWLVLGLLVLPTGILDPLSASMLPAAAAVPLVGLAAREYRLDVSIRTGIYSLAGLIVLAMLHQADVGSLATFFASGLLKQLMYYAVLLLLAYHLVRTGDLSIEHLTTALLIGIVSGAVLELAHGTLDGSGSHSPLVYGRKFGMLSAMGFSLVVARALLPPRSDRLRDDAGWNGLLAVFLGVVTAMTMGRAAWLSAGLGASLAVVWTRRTRWVVVAPVLVAVVLAVPTARERIVPQEGLRDVNLQTYTTGRTRLWVEALEAGDGHLVAGNGWGWWWSNTPEELFGFRTFVMPGKESQYVHLHNDWLLLVLELGVLGVGLMALFWGHLLVVFRRLLRAGGEHRRTAITLGGVLVSYCMMQLVENAFVGRPVGERFFIVAGAIFATAATLAPSSRSLPAVRGAASPNDRH